MKKRLFLITSAIALTTVVFFNSCEKVEQGDEGNFAEELLAEKPDADSYNFGVIPLPKEEYLRIPLASEDQDFKSTTAKKMLATPKIRNQGTEGSCVAWGVAYAARSIRKKAQTRDRTFSVKKNIMSPEYLYNTCLKKNGSCQNCKAGTYMSTALNILKNRGVCLWNKMPYSDRNGCCKQPNSAQNKNAKSNKSAYSRIKITVSSLKSNLNKNQPVVIAGPVDRTYMKLKRNGILRKYNQSTYEGHHCVCIIGYDDSKKAFKFMNSWGTGWSTSGFGYIAYKNIKEWIDEAYVLR